MATIVNCNKTSILDQENVGFNMRYTTWTIVMEIGGAKKFGFIRISQVAGQTGHVFFIIWEQFRYSET